MSDTKGTVRWGRRLVVTLLGAGLALMVGASSAVAEPVPEMRVTKGLVGRVQVSAAPQQAAHAEAGGESIALEGSIEFDGPLKTTESSIPVAALTLDGASEKLGHVRLELVGDAEVVLDAAVGIPPRMSGSLEVTLKLTVEKPADGLRAEQEFKGALTAEGITSPGAFLEKPWKGGLKAIDADTGRTPELGDIDPMCLIQKTVGAPQDACLGL